MIERDMKGQAKWILLDAICPVQHYVKKRQTEQLETFESVFEQISTEALLYTCEQNAEI